MIQEIADALAQSWRNFADAFVQFVPRLVAATIIFAGGFVVAIVARRAVRRLLAWLCFDRLALRTGASEMLRVADMPSAELLVAKIVFWIVWIGFIVSAVDTLQFGPFQGLVEEFFRFVPRVLVALLVLALGFLVGNFVWRATLLASVNAGLPGARLLSGTLRLLVIAIAVVMALEQLGLATTVVLTAFAIAFGALMLGLAIAFGLGGRDAARLLLEHHLTSAGKARDRRRSRISDPVMPCCSPLERRAPPSDFPAGTASASATWAPAPSSSSTCSRPPASASGRCCRSARPATAIPRISASPRSRAIRCSSASMRWSSRDCSRRPRPRAPWPSPTVTSTSPPCSRTGRRSGRECSIGSMRRLPPQSAIASTASAVRTPPG